MGVFSVKLTEVIACACPRRVCMKTMYGLHFGISGTVSPRYEPAKRIQ